ncbi:tetraacyldisaccharide 4'-kinase [Seongchinamella sediminis]|uniref:Tetraacyldisaccharide 4'-kinase n=1 Tax=Seongchinamella sediminis TaxID=2283635 RepID=A0A3L7DZR5_9GAMM|nr:tetraacyldisaccharide 4'-kinase [Seongchinamella sediminis]RLQ23087.1 tetraacyldisaccharide 4'-kinase [Seongchinamella sediminis]
MTAADSGLAAAWYRGAWWLWLLLPLEGLFRAVAAMRRWLYRSGLWSSYRASCPVAVVGNITVGGTGKTPVIIALVEALQARGLTPGVVSRGYGATAGEFPHRVGANSSAAQCGDEPLLIHRRTGAPCVVDPDRAAAVRALLAAGPVDVVLADDGLQHYALQRDYELALLDAARGTGNGHCLPVGPLREPASRLDSVNRVLYRGGEDAASSVSYRPTAWVNVASGEERPLSAFSGGEGMVAVAGIGQPAQFFASLEALGIRCDERSFADHHQYRPQDFAPLQGSTILMTEKDAVKCRSLAGADAWYLRIEASLPPAVVEEICALVRS